MRFDVKRLMGVSALSLFLSLGMAGCSGQQQAEDGVEVSEQGDGQGTDNQVADNGADNQAANQSEEVADGQAAPTNEETANVDAAPNGSENDLQEIIQEMNGQPAAETAAAPAEASAAATDVAAPAPAEAAGSDVAAAPATPAPEAPAASPAPAGHEAAAAAPSSGPAMAFQPGGSPAANGLPEIGSKMAYVVEEGDTLGKISRKIFGTPSRFNELASLSGITNPSRIFPGDVVYYTLDEKAVSFAQAYEGTQRMEVQIGSGETLAALAKRVYGSSKAWRSIWRQNDKIDNPDVVPPGTTLYYMPLGAATAAAKKIQNKLANTEIKKLFNSKSKKIAKNNILKSSNTQSIKFNTHSQIVAQKSSAQILDRTAKMAMFLNI